MSLVLDQQCPLILSPLSLQEAKDLLPMLAKSQMSLHLDQMSDLQLALLILLMPLTLVHQWPHHTSQEQLH